MFRCRRSFRGLEPQRLEEEGRHSGPTILTKNSVNFTLYVQLFQLQWESDYQKSLVFKWLKVVCWPNGLVFECHLNTGLNLVQYSDHHLNAGKVKICQCVAIVNKPTSL